MKYLKPLISLSIVSVVVLALFYLWRRTNILLSSINSLRGDLAELKHIPLREGAVPESLVGDDTNEAFVDAPSNQLENKQKIEDTQQNITLLKSSIEQLENMISSSEGEYESSMSDSETEEEELAVAGDVDENNDHIMSYGLDAPETNSELNDLLNNKSEEITDSKKEIISVESNQPGVTLQKNITDEVKIDVILNSYNKKQLENLCGDANLSKSGSKTALIKRLLSNGHEFKTINEVVPEISSQN